MRQRHRSLFRSTLYGDSPLPGNITVYNAFPEIDITVKGAYYLPFIDGVFLSRELEGSNRKSRIIHELTHKSVANVVSTCEQRFLTYLALAAFTTLLADSHRKLLIPSFTPIQDNVMLPNGSEGGLLEKIAETLDYLYATTNMIQEIIACAVQAEEEGWDREKTKEIIMKESADLSEQLLDEFLDVYDHIGWLSAQLLGRYALNTIDRDQALERFQRGIQLAREFKFENDIFGRFLAFSEYLYENLPDYNDNSCPLVGNCHASNLELVARSRPDMPKLLLHGARLMKYLGCGGKEEFPIPYVSDGVPIGGISPDLLRVLSSMDPFNTALYMLATEDPFYKNLIPHEFLELQVMPLTCLSMIEIEPNVYKVFVNPDAGEKVAVKLRAQDVELTDLMFLESLWEQIWNGIGPLCFCAPYIQEECPYRFMLAKVWRQTEPDPMWKQSWKPKNHPPECIKELL
jgi:hypothetical protein